MERSFSTTDLGVGAPPEVATMRPEPSRMVVGGGALEAEVRTRLAGWLETARQRGGDLAAAIPGARIVKQRRLRTVLRVPPAPPLPALYVKLHRTLGAWRTLRSAFRRSSARLEVERATEVRRLGLVAPAPLAYAEWRDGPWLVASVSVTEELGGAGPIDAYLDGVPEARRRAAVSALAEALAAVHARGVDTTDAHRANLLVLDRDDGRGPLTLGLVDLASVRLRKVTARRRIARAAQLVHSLLPALRSGEQRAFLEAYARASGVSPSAVDSFLGDCEHRVRRVHARRERSRDRRCRVESTDFAVERGAWRRTYRRRAVPPELVRRVAELGRTPEDLERAGARLVKREGRNECFVVPAQDGDRFVKRVRASSVLGAVGDAFRGSRGLRAWSVAHALARRGIPVPRAYALVEEGPLVPLRSTLVLENVEGATTLRDVLATWPSRFPSLRDRRAFLAAVAESVARLHVRGVDHDDLATKNFLVRWGPPVECLVIDLEAVRSLDRPLPRGRLLRALMQLDDCPRTVTRAERMRFLVAYERATRTRFTRADLADVRRMLRERFARSGRDYEREGPR